MSGEDQEQLKDYLALEAYIKELQAGHAVQPPQDLTPDEARVYRMAKLFHSTSPEARKLRPEFADELGVRLEQELQQTAKRQHLPLKDKKLQKKSPTVSRRSLLTSGAAIAASLTIGGGIEHAIEQAQVNNNPPEPPAPPQPTTIAHSTPLVPTTAPSTWHVVAQLADLGDNAIRFTTDTVVGYVLRNTGKGSNYDESTARDDDQIIAMSAACTHMGCIVQWQHSDRKFHCPCHGGIFDENGDGVVAPGSIRYLLPLPRLETKVENDKVYVYVPISQK
jgi:Rieske Fe-S protein